MTDGLRQQIADYRSSRSTRWMRTSPRTQYQQLTRGRGRGKSPGRPAAGLRRRRQRPPALRLGAPQRGRTGADRRDRVPPGAPGAGRARFAVEREGALTTDALRTILLLGVVAPPFLAARACRVVRVREHGAGVRRARAAVRCNVRSVARRARSRTSGSIRRTATLRIASCAPQPADAAARRRAGGVGPAADRGLGDTLLSRVRRAPRRAARDRAHRRRRQPARPLGRRGRRSSSTSATHRVHRLDRRAAAQRGLRADRRQLGEASARLLLRTSARRVRLRRMNPLPRRARIPRARVRARRVVRPRRGAPPARRRLVVRRDGRVATPGSTARSREIGRMRLRVAEPCWRAVGDAGRAAVIVIPGPIRGPICRRRASTCRTSPGASRRGARMSLFDDARRAMSDALGWLASFFPSSDGGAARHRRRRACARRARGRAALPRERAAPRHGRLPPVVVDDASIGSRAGRALDHLARTEPRVVLLRNQVNQGFVQSANRGMNADSTRDVLLLNSDTEVPSGFLDRSRRAVAHRAHRHRVAVHQRRHDPEPAALDDPEPAARRARRRGLRRARRQHQSAARARRS